MTIDNSGEKTLAGSIGFFGGLLGFALVAGTLLIAFSPSDSMLASFVAGHKMSFRGMLWVAFFGSIFTFLCSLFGKAMQRGFGVAISIVNFLASICILGAGE